MHVYVNFSMIQNCLRGVQSFLFEKVSHVKLQKKILLVHAVYVMNSEYINVINIKTD